MKDKYLIIITVVAIIIIVVLIINIMHNDAIQESMLICMNSAMHTNRSLPVEEAARICGGFVK